MFWHFVISTNLSSNLPTVFDIRTSHIEYIRTVMHNLCLIITLMFKYDNLVIDKSEKEATALISHRTAEVLPSDWCAHTKYSTLFSFTECNSVCLTSALFDEFAIPKSFFWPSIEQSRVTYEHVCVIEILKDIHPLISFEYFGVRKVSPVRKSNAIIDKTLRDYVIIKFGIYQI